ncbi:amidohydrolase family protein, partial [Rubrimonas sp.]|uniref:amidohydrolase family protein n=1 Tax=Rubrimonas sp. TaxID=2036015 RepID=UPI002FDC905C
MASPNPVLSGPVTAIRRAAWIVGWDAAAGAHVYRRNGDVAWAGDRLVTVGGRHEGPVAHEIDGADRLVIPGLIDVHCHPTQTPIFRGFVEEFGNPRLFYSSRQHFRQSFLQDHAAQLASARYGLAELAACGATSIVDLSHAYRGWLPLLAESGLRVWAAPMFRSARWWTDTGHEIKYDWADDMGASAFEEAQAVMDEAEAHPCGRLSALVTPAQVDTCTPELLVAAAELARRTGRSLHTHGAQSYPEFNGMLRRHDKTPIEYLHGLGFLGPRTIIGHAVFTDEHPWLNWPRRRDLALLAETGASVAHCPTVFARDASMMHHLGAYMDAGVNIAIGTDTHPQNMIEEMRTAETIARLAAGPRHTCSTARVFHAATIGAARLLGREDIGRLAPGAKADIVVCDLTEPNMVPLR